MEQLFEKYKNYLLTEKRVSSLTFDAYCTDIQQLLDFMKTQNKISITTDDLKEFLGQLKQNNVASRSMARKISSIKAFFGYLAKYHGIVNCAEPLLFPKLEQRLPRCLSESDIESLLSVAGNDRSAIGLRNRAMVSLLYVSGMRISELVGLKRSDIHFDTGLICVRGKGGKDRMIPLPLSIQELLKDFCEIRPAPQAPVAQENHEDYLFTTTYGHVIRPITRQACWILLKKLWQKTGIQKEISPHVLRHSLATHLLKHGADLRSLQMLLGHEQLSTVQLYTHVETSYLRTIYDKKHPRS